MTAAAHVTPDRTHGPRPSGPRAVLEGARLSADRVRVKTRPLFAWTVFRRERLERHALELPAAEPIGAGAWRVRLSAAQPGANFLELSLAAHAGERFVGFGERFNGVDQRGWKLETWAE
jgi:hypothetical protein